jgi:predicted GIY-YIG superfamily endonuclease
MKGGKFLKSVKPLTLQNSLQCGKRASDNEAIVKATTRSSKISYIWRTKFFLPFLVPTCYVKPAPGTCTQLLPQN